MKDFFIEDDDLDAEVSFLSEKNTFSDNADVIDPYNPFDNPTENRDYNMDYTEIVPQIALDGCKLPNIPSDTEKKKIRHFYNIAGGGIALHFLLTLIISNALSLVVMFVIMLSNGMSISEFFNSSSDNIMQFINTSSISPAITILTYLTANLTVFFFGIKFSGINAKSLFNTSGLTILKVIQYILIAFCLQYTGGILIGFIQNVMSDADIYGTAQSLTTYYTPKYAVLSILYSCAVAPVTEELMYRGFILKNFSRVSQRFGIFAGAFFFGLSHGNIAQFILAFTMGVFMGYITTKHNSVLPSIIVHMAVNTLATLFTVAGNYFSDNNIISFVMNTTLILLTMIGIAVLILLARNNVFPKADIRQQYRGRNVAVTSAGTVIAAIIYIIFILLQTFA